MNRQRLLLLAVLVLVAGNLAYRVWAGWGLITVNVTDAPLSTVMASVAKQGGVGIRTNLEADKKVTMHVKKVAISYAMEVLASATDARVELGYFLAPAKPPIDAMLTAFAAGEKPEGWQRFHIPLPPGGMPGSSDEGTSDPRLDRWEVKPAAEGTLQAYLEQAAKHVSARLEAPKEWNPAISSAPKSGEIQDVMPRLAKSAGGAVEQVFLLTGRRRDAEAPPGDGPPEPIRRALGMLAGGAGQDDAAMEKMLRAMGDRIQTAIDQMPADKKAKAQAEFDEGKKFFESMKDLTPDERRAKMEERMQDPATQEKFFNSMAKREAMKSPSQRNERYREYLGNKTGRQN